MDLPSKAPPPRDSFASALEEAGRWRGASAEQRYRRLVEACHLADVILAAREDRLAVLARRDPLPAESVALIERLRRPWRERWAGRG